MALVLPGSLFGSTVKASSANSFRHFLPLSSTIHYIWWVHWFYDDVLIEMTHVPLEKPHFRAQNGDVSTDLPAQRGDRRMRGPDRM